MCPYQYNLMHIQCKCLCILSPLFTPWQILCKLSLLSPPLLSVPLGSGSLSVIKSCFVLCLGCNGGPWCGATVIQPGDGHGGGLQASIAHRCREQIGAPLISPCVPTTRGQVSLDVSQVVATCTLTSVPVSYTSASCVPKPVGARQAES